MNYPRVEVEYGTNRLVIETGKLAKQASGAVLVRCGGTAVLVTVCIAGKAYSYPAIAMRATQKNMISGAVTRSLVG